MVVENGTALCLAVGEPHDAAVLQGMLDHLEELKRLGVEAIND